MKSKPTQKVSIGAVPAAAADARWGESCVLLDCFTAGLGRLVHPLCTLLVVVESI